MATNKVSAKTTEQIIEEMISNGVDEKTIQNIRQSLESKGVVSSDRGSIQFKDENGNYWRASLTWKSVITGSPRVDSESMIKMKEYFEKGKEKFGSMVKALN